MVQEHSHAEYVSKHQVLLWLGSAVVSIGIFGWTLHVQQVDKEVYETTLKHQAEWRDEQRRELGEIKEAILEIQREQRKRDKD